MQELYHLLETVSTEQQTAMFEQSTANPLLRTRVLSLLATAAKSETLDAIQDAAVTPEL